MSEPNNEEEVDNEETDGDALTDLAVSSKKGATRRNSDPFGASSTFDWNNDVNSPGSTGTSSASFKSTMVIELRTLIEHDYRFVGKTIIITGAGGQLGREGCCYFARRGAKIAALDRSKDGLKETFDILNKEVRIQNADGTGNILTFDFKPYVCDVTNVEQMKGVVDSIVHRYTSIDYLWNNAGYQGKIKPLLLLDCDDYRMTMDINVNGMFIVLQTIAKKMIELQTTNCSIVNTASLAGQRGTPYMAGYSASKAAVLGLSINAAKELAPYNIRVNTISPALIGPGFLWERQNKLHAKAGPPFYNSNPDIVGQQKIDSVPLKRLGTPEEVVNVVAFLFSNDSSYITGTNINIDGGMGCSLKA